MTEFGKQVLDLLSQSRLVTPRVLERWFDKTPNQIKNELRRLRTESLVESHSFIGKQVYYRLTEATCRRLNLSRRLSGPLGPQAIRRDYGVLHFVAHTTPPRKLLTPADWKTLASELGNKPASAKLPNHQLYLDCDKSQSDKPYRVGLIIVDGRTDAPSLLRKPAAFISQHRQDAVLRRLVADDDFLFSFVTESEGKADSIAAAYEAAGLNQPIRLHVCSDLSAI